MLYTRKISAVVNIQGYLYFVQIFIQFLEYSLIL